MKTDTRSKRVTATTIESWQTLARQAKKRLDKSDSDVPGLAIAIEISGKVRFKLRYRMGDAKLRSYRIEYGATTTLEQARIIARKALESVKAGEDPNDRDAQKREADARADVEARMADERRITFGQLAERWLTEGRGSKRTAGTIQINKYQLDRDVLPVIGDTLAADVNSDDMQVIAGRFFMGRTGRDSGRKRDAKVACNRTLELVRAIFAWGAAKKRLGITSNPVAELIVEDGELPGGSEASRKRYLNANADRGKPDEIAPFWSKLSEAGMTAAMQRALKLALLTGQRIGNVTAMEVREVNIKARLWSIPWNKVKGRRKDDGPHDVPLSDLALGIVLESINGNGGSRFLFPSPRGEQAIEGHAAATALRRAQAHFGFDEPFTPHDLRRTAATGMALLGTPSSVVGHVLAHREVTNATLADDVYIGHGYLKEKRAALDGWGDHVCGLVGLIARNSVNEDSNIISIKSAI